jgi:thioredoxin-dependent peroxiredoxin
MALQHETTNSEDVTPKSIICYTPSRALQGQTRNWAAPCVGNTVARQKFLRVGDVAPDFALPRSNGELVSLSDFRGRSEVVLFFYPKDRSPVCTAEACSFRDSYDMFRARGAEVIGISADSALSHERFAARFRLPFVLLSDSDGSVRRRYGVAKTLGIFPGRATYLIDRQGVIRHIFSSQFLPLQHVSSALGALERLRDEQ